jgi:hypothetical protein
MEVQRNLSDKSEYQNKYSDRDEKSQQSAAYGKFKDNVHCGFFIHFWFFFLCSVFSGLSY